MRRGDGYGRSCDNAADPGAITSRFGQNHRVDPFLIAHNPDPDSSLPFLVRLPIESGILLKTKEDWPRASRVYCHPVETWPDEAEIISEVPVKLCRRRGSAIDLVLDRRINSRSQFVFTTLRGRDVIFWQTAKAAKGSRPGVRVPKRRAAGLRELHVVIDTRERYPYRFASHPVEVTRSALAAGDYAVMVNEVVVAAVERKTSDDFRKSLVDGSLSFLMADLSALPAAAVVVEERYSSMLHSEHVEPGWIAELIGRVQVRYPSVPVVFCDARKFAEEWTYRFLGAAYAELGVPIREALEQPDG